MKWPTLKLGQIAGFRNGLNFTSENFGVGLKVINVADFKQRSTPDYDSIGEINPQGVADDRDLLQDGDIVFVRSNGNRDLVGRSMLIRNPPTPVSHSAFTIRLRFESEPASPHFYSYFFRSALFRKNLSSLGAGTNICNLNQKILGALEVPAPARAIQEAVTGSLSVYDDLLENNLRRITILESAARLLYQEWFVRLRFPGHEHTDLAAGVPAGWERMPFEDALALQRGFDLPAPQWQEGTFPICGSNGVIGHHIEARVKGPGVYTGRSGSLGVVNYAYEDYWPHNTALWVREFKKVTPLFALFLLREMNLRQYNGGASVPTLDRKAVHRVPVLIPPPKLITLFDEHLGPLFAQLRNLQQQNQKLREARDLLLPRLMSGEIPV